MGQTRQKSFSDRWRELAVDDTVNIATDQTITPRTVGLGGRSADQGPATPPPDSLPRISLRHSDAAPTTGATEQRQPDITLYERLGAGGMGQVRRAEQRSLGREVAVKMLNENADSTLANALISEAVLTGFLAHPGIIPVHSLGLDDDGRPLLVMKRIEGASWRALLADRSHPAWESWKTRSGGRLLAHLEIISQLCDALHFAHSHGVIHRDIKPDNVMLGGFGEVYLVDWGVAVRVTEQVTGQLVGTPAYMAPEMAAGEPVDARTDVYLLGATLHEILTGALRHPGQTLGAVVKAALESREVQYPADVAPQLAELCNRATSLDPELRPQTALEFRTAIADYLRHRSSIALSDAANERLSQLRAARAQSNAPVAEIALRASNLAAEARFGFSRALDEWPENRAAVDGLERCRHAQAEIQLSRRDAVAARALLREMTSPPPELEPRIAELEEQLREEHEERARLAALDRDLDRSVGKRARLAGYMVVALVAVGLVMIAHFQEGGVSALTHRQAFAFGSTMALAIAIGVLVKRKQLFANAFNRRATTLVGFSMAVLVLDRAIAWAIAMPLQYMFLIDATMLATACGAAGIVLMRWIAWVALLLLATAVAIAAAPPAQAPLFFSVGTFIGILVAIANWRRTD